MSKSILEKVGYNDSRANQLESRFLGSLLAREDAILEVYDELGHFTEKVFEGRVERSVFEAIYKLAEDGKEVNAMTVSHLSGVTEKILAGYVKEHNDAGCKKSVTYAGMMYDNFIKRTATSILQEAITDVMTGKDLYKRISAVLGDLSSILDNGATKYEKTAEEAADEAMKEIIRVQEMKARGEDTVVTGIPTGLRTVDVFTQGHQLGSLTIVAARPGMGKSALVTKTAYIASLKGFPVGIFTLEMKSAKVAKRMMSMIGHVESDKFKTANYASGDIEKVNKAHRVARGLPIQYYEKGSATYSDIKRHALKWKRMAGLKLLIIDYIQIMGEDDKDRNRATALSRIANRLKGLALDLDIAIVCLAQIGRDSVKGRNSNLSKRPTMEDIKESGGMEEAADVVQLIYRPEHYGIETYPNGDPTAGLAEIIIPKNREGSPNKTLIVGWRGEMTEFYDLDDGRFPEKEPIDYNWKPEDSNQFPSIPPDVSVTADRNDDGDIPF